MRSGSGRRKLEDVERRGPSSPPRGSRRRCRPSWSGCRRRGSPDSSSRECGGRCTMPGERELGEHVARRHVEVLGGAFTPRRDFLRDATRPAPQLARAFDAPPRELRFGAACARAGVGLRTRRAPTRADRSLRAVRRARPAVRAGTRRRRRRRRFCSAVSGRRVQSVSRSPLPSRAPSSFSTSATSDGEPSPTNPAATCVSNKCVGTVAAQARRGSRGPARPRAPRCSAGRRATARDGRASTASGSTSAMPLAPRDLDQREPGPVRAFAVELGVEAEPGLVGRAPRRGRRAQPRQRSSGVPHPYLAGCNSRAHVREAFEGPQHLGLVVGEVAHDDVRVAHLAEVGERRRDPCDPARDRRRGVEAPVAARQDRAPRPGPHRRRRRRRGCRAGSRSSPGVRPWRGTRLAVRVDELPRLGGRRLRPDEEGVAEPRRAVDRGAAPSRRSTPRAAPAEPARCGRSRCGTGARS